MGHVLFCILHLLAILFGLVGLIVTVPLHIIYACLKGNKAKSSAPDQSAS